MTAFSLVMLGKLVFLVVFVSFFAVVASLRLNPAVSLFFFSFVYFVKWVLDVRRPKLFHSGGKKGRTRRATQA